MKKLIFIFLVFFIVVFDHTIVAQEIGSLKVGKQISFPKKMQKQVLSPLPAGTYTVGISGYFPTIDSAFNKLSGDGISGEVTLELIDSLYTAPLGSFGFTLNGPISGAGPKSRVTIKPALNKNVTIEGNGESLLNLLNTSYVTFDGVGVTGATTLTIHTFKNTAYTYNDALDFKNNSDHNVVQNITFIVDDYLRASGGIWFSGSSSDSNVIQYNVIKKGGIFISITGGGKGNIIRGNQIGSETDSLVAYGIEVGNSDGTLIENNLIQNMKATLSGSNQAQIGIALDGGNIQIIRNNIIRNCSTISGYITSGIYVGVGGTNNQVYNNMVSGIHSTSKQADSRLAGIYLAYQTNPKVYYNSVYLYGTGANHLGSAALYIYTSCTNVRVMNNILVNTRNESPYFASSIYDYSVSNLISQNNNLYSEQNQYNCAVRIGSNNYKTLTDWQKTGKDKNSLNEKVNFISPTDLHINNNYSTRLDGMGTPIAEILTDFDSDTRDAASPDIGADEFYLESTATNWQIQNSNFPADILVVDFSSVNEQVCWAIGQVYPGNTTPYAGYIRTIDGGNNWICDTISGITNSYLQQVFAIDEDTAYITVYKVLGSSGNARGIYKTTDGGTSWNRQEAYNSSQSGPGNIHFFDSQNGVVIGDPNLETYTTTNGGLTWNPVTMPTVLSGEYTWIGNSRITSVGDTVWFGTNRRLFKSIDKGYNWSVILNETQYYDWTPSIAFQDHQTGIYALKKSGTATDHIFRRTTDGGASWITLSDSSLDNIAPSCIQHIPGTSSTYIVSGGRTSLMRGTTITYDAGESWKLIDTEGCYALDFTSNVVGWGSQYSSNVVQKYVGPKIQDPILAVEEEIISLLPSGYSLSQNYPNPFNPSTKITYSVPKQSNVTLKVFDVLGREVSTLLNEEKSTGTYELTWHAENIPSGVYFYQLKAGEFTVSKKMILLK